MLLPACIISHSADHSHTVGLKEIHADVASPWRLRLMYSSEGCPPQGAVVCEVCVGTSVQSRVDSAGRAARGVSGTV